MIGFKTIALAAGLSTAALAGAASAATVSVGGLVDSANNTATVDVSYQANLGTLTFGVENTGDSIITGFAFNTPTTVTGIRALSVTGLSAEANASFDILVKRDGVETPQPAGRFDVGATADNDRNQETVTRNPSINGGFTANGIGIGETATFVFSLVGTNLAMLTVDSFLSLMSDPKNQNDGSYAFAVRFQAAPGEGSDVGVPVNEVPLPAAGLLMLAGLGGLIGLRRRAA